MEQKNSEYWEKRIANETWETYNAIEEQNVDLLEMYEKADKSIRNELYILMEKAESDDLSRTESYKMAHLKELRSKIKKECEKLGDEVEESATKRITQGAEKVSENIAKNFGDEFHALPKKTMEQLLRQPWHGSNFSSRLWGDTGKLVKNLDDIIVNGLTQGKTATEMAVQLSNTMNKSFNEAHRLVRTETINTLNRSTMESYKKAGVKKVQWWAAEDERTCPQCGSKHERIFDIDKEPNLPCHPGCRCTWLPYFSEIKTKNIEIPDFAKKNKEVNNDEKRMQKLKSFANDKLKIQDIDLSGIDYQIAKNVLNSITDVYNKFPEIAGSIRNIKILSDQSVMMGLAPFRGNYKNYTLYLNDKLLSNLSSLNKRIERTVLAGVYAQGTTAETITYHELGHLLEGRYINATYAKENQQSAWESCEAATEILEKASIKCYNNENYSEVLKSISKYAMESSSEGLAECLHLQLTGRGNEFTEEVLSVIMKGVKG